MKKAPPGTRFSRWGLCIRLDAPPKGEPFKVGVISDGSTMEPLRLMANPIAKLKFTSDGWGSQLRTELSIR
jgi:hypothetical protein